MILPVAGPLRDRINPLVEQSSASLEAHCPLCDDEMGKGEIKGEETLLDEHTTIYSPSICSFDVYTVTRTHVFHPKEVKHMTCHAWFR